MVAQQGFPPTEDLYSQKTAEVLSPPPPVPIVASTSSSHSPPSLMTVASKGSSYLDVLEDIIRTMPERISLSDDGGKYVADAPPPTTAAASPSPSRDNPQILVHHTGSNASVDAPTDTTVPNSPLLDGMSGSSSNTSTAESGGDVGGVVDESVSTTPELTTLCAYLGANPSLHNPEVLNCLLDICVEAQSLRLMDEVVGLYDAYKVPKDAATCEILLGGYGRMNAKQRVEAILDWMKEQGQAPTLECYASIVEGFFQNEDPMTAVVYIQRMHEEGYPVHPSLVTTAIRLAYEKAVLKPVLKHLYPSLPNLKEEDTTTIQKNPQSRPLSIVPFIEPSALSNCLPLPLEGLEVILDNCAESEDVATALQIESLAVGLNVEYSHACYDAAIRLYGRKGDQRTMHLFDALTTTASLPADGEKKVIEEATYISFLNAACLSQFIPFVERILDHVQGNSAITPAIYSAALSCFLFAGQMDKAGDLYTTMVKDPESCQVDDIESELVKTKPDSFNYVRLLRNYLQGKQLPKALDLFHSLQQSGLPVDATTYNLMIEISSACGELQTAMRFFQEMKAKACVDITSYNAVIKCYCGKGNLDSCRALLVEMRSKGVSPNEVTYNSVINAAVSLGYYEMAWKLIEEMKAAQLKVDHLTCNIMLKVLRTSTDRRMIERVLSLVDEVDPCQDEALFNAVLDACVKLKDTRRMVAAMERFKRSNMRPDLQTNGVLIKALGSCGRIDDCQYLWRELTEERGLDPNEVTYGCMFDALVSNNRVEEAVQLFDEMKARGRIRPNTIMYSTIIKGFAQAKQLDRALSVYQEMKSFGVLVNTVTYNSIVDACARVGAMDKAAALLEDMLSNGVEPDLITFSTIIKGYCVHGDMDRSLQLLRAMAERDIRPDGILYNSLLDGCVKAGRPDLCEDLWEEMRASGIAPSNFTLTILIKMYGRTGQLEKAFKLVEELPVKYGFEINAHVYTCLMSACITNRKFQMAYEVFNCMQRDGIRPDAKTYETIIYGCTKGGQYRQAAELVEQAFGMQGPLSEWKPPHPNAVGFKLEHRTYRYLVQQLHSSNLYEEVGYPLVEKLRRCRILVGQTLSPNSQQSSTSRHSHHQNSNSQGGSNNYSNCYVSFTSASSTTSTPATSSATALRQHHYHHQTSQRTRSNPSSPSVDHRTSSFHPSRQTTHLAPTGPTPSQQQQHQSRANPPAFALPRPPPGSRYRVGGAGLFGSTWSTASTQSSNPSSQECMPTYSPSAGFSRQSTAEDYGSLPLPAAGAYKKGYPDDRNKSYGAQFHSIQLDGCYN